MKHSWPMAAEKHGEIINGPLLALGRFISRVSPLHRGYFHFNWRLLNPVPPSPSSPSPYIFHYFDADAIRPRPPRKKIAVHRVIVAQKAKLTILRRRSSFFFLLFFFTKRRIKRGSKGSINVASRCKTLGRFFNDRYYPIEGGNISARVSRKEKKKRHELLPVGFTKIIGRIIYCRNLCVYRSTYRTLVTPITTNVRYVDILPLIYTILSR